MAVKDLTFSRQDNGRYSSEYTASGKRSAVQLAREKASEVIIYLRVTGMTGWCASSIYYNASKDFAFEVNVPAGMEVKVESMTKVTTCKLLEEG